MTDGTKGGAADPKGKGKGKKTAADDTAAPVVDTAAEIDGQLSLDGWPVIDDTGEAADATAKFLKDADQLEAEIEKTALELPGVPGFRYYKNLSGEPGYSYVYIPGEDFTWARRAEVMRFVYRTMADMLAASKDEDRKKKAAEMAEFAESCPDIAARYEIYLQYIREEMAQHTAREQPEWQIDPAFTDYYYFLFAYSFIKHTGIQAPGPGKVEPDQGEKDAITDMIAKSFSEEKAEIEETIADIWDGALVRPNSKKTTLTTSRAARDQLSIAAESENGNAALIDVGNGADITAFIYRQEVTVQKITPQEKLGLTPEGIELQDAIGSLFDAAGGGPAYMTPAQIYREFAGLKAKTPITKAQEAWIMDEVDNMATLRTRIDYTMQASKHKDLQIDPDTATIEDYVINATKIKTKVGGHVTNCYRINAQLPYYEYSRKIHQAQAVDKKMLEYPGRNNTRRFALLKRILQKIVLHMKSEQEDDKPTPRGIYEPRRTYTGIFERMGITPTEKEAKSIKRDIDLLLEYWKKQGHIKDYSHYSNKGQRARAGIKIELCPLEETDQRPKVKK